MKKVISAGHICLDITPVFPAEKQYDQLSSLLVPGKLIQTEAADKVFEKVGFTPLKGK